MEKESAVFGILPRTFLWTQRWECSAGNVLHQRSTLGPGSQQPGRTLYVFITGKSGIYVADILIVIYDRVRKHERAT
ncbi:AAEL014338-PA [Aedes aegypti]|uniref:AAEL014338-PA n=1 Tax=Aedes aegypti TaxID=7159 RepID=Q16GL7_AEDAE|nr:AAEL014338-PA [Aedes aegypti]